MAAKRSDPLEALRAALADLAAAEAPEVVAQARAAARARARTLIEDTLVEELLCAAAAEHRAEQPERRPAEESAGQSKPSERGEPSAPKPSERGEPNASDLAREQAEARPEGEAWWAYCILAATERDAVPSGLGGVEPRSEVEAIQEGQLLALVSPVPLSEFSDERVRDHLNDIEWVERVARAHERVLEQVLEVTTILPLRLCTLYRDRAGVRRMLREQEPMLGETLSDLEGRREWGVKVFVDQEGLGHALEEEPGSPEGEATPTAKPSTGAQYMARRQRERKASERVTEVGDEIVQGIHERVARVAERSRTNPLQRPEVHGRRAQMLHNGAYLVRREREQEFRDVAATLQARWSKSGFEVELTGPWPPYNFVSPSAMVTP